MSDTNTEICHENAKSAAQPEAIVNKSAEKAETLWRSERTETLTEMRGELQEERLKNAQWWRRIIYENWWYYARVGKEILTDEALRM